MKLTFYGGAMSVTGANYLLDFDGLKILVDCGLFQGSKYAESLNYAQFVYDPKEIDYVFVTHSHIDHIGRIPKLFKDGFRGKIYTVEPTRALMERAFPDNWSLIAKEAEEEGHPPLYGMEDIEATMKLVEGVPYHQKIKLADNVSVTFFDAGHILGSAITCFEYDEKKYVHRSLSEPSVRKIYVTGDLGNSPSLLLPDKEFVHDADSVVVESAYGGRVHENRDARSAVLLELIGHVVSNRGTLMIPSFAIERTQEILFEINKLIQAKAIPSIPVFIDSPLAIKMTEVYGQYHNYLKEEARDFFGPGKNIFEFSSLRYTQTVDESKSINNVPPPKIIIAGSGMSNGGRILHHERRYLSDPNSAIAFVGYQVEGSLGRRILDGNKEVSIFGEKVPVRCVVKGIGGYSAHADQLALTEWVKQAFEGKKPTLLRPNFANSTMGKQGFGGPSENVFVVQGEESSSNALAEVIKSRTRIEAIVPKPGEEFEL